MKADLVINGNTGIDDLIELHEKGITELYSFQTISNMFIDAGVPEVLAILLKEIEVRDEQ